MGHEAAEFSRLVSVEDLGSGIVERRLTASKEECSALAERFRLSALRNFSADLVLTRKGRSDLVVLEGHLTAEVEQPCVVTLDPVTETVDERFVTYFTFGSGESVEAEVTIDPEADDPPEPVGPEGIDVGEAVAQQLSVAINPYPRAADADEILQVMAATPESADAADSGGEGSSQVGGNTRGDNPFAILRALKGGRKDGEG